MRYRMSLLTLLALLLTAPNLAASEAELRALLAGIDSVPSASALASVAPEPTSALLAVALDEDAPMYLRQRAVTLQSTFPGGEAEEALSVLMDVGPARLRALAAYTYARSFAQLAPDLVVERLRPLLERDDDIVQRYAARGLGWVPGTEARVALRAAAERAPSEGLAASIRAAERRRALGRPLPSRP